jgi:GT2 family glycosyltransferase
MAVPRKPSKPWRVLSEPMLSVVVATRGRADQALHLLRQLQSAPVAEILVADDNPDPTIQPRLSSLGQLSVPVRVIETGGIGPSQARNRAVERSEGGALWFLDDDVELPPGTAHAMRKAVTRHPHDVIAGAVSIVARGSGPRVCPQHSIDFPLAIPASRPCAPGEVWACNMVVPLSAYNSVGGFPEDAEIYGEEYELMRRIAGRGVVLRHVQGVGVHHIRQGDALGRQALLLRRWLRGRHQVANARRYDWSLHPLRTELRHMAGGLAHYLSTRCWGGLLQSVQVGGRLYQRLHCHDHAGGGAASG